MDLLTPTAFAPARTVSTPRERLAHPVLTVDLDAVAANTRLIARRTAGELMAVVKADGFGHGAVDVARTALEHGAARLGVTSLAEAWAVREARISAPLLSWLNPVDADWVGAAARHVEVAVPSLDHLAAVAAAPGCLDVHLHLDVGMCRDGAEPTVWPALMRAARLAQRRGQLRVVGVMGHLGCADHPGDACNHEGRARFAAGVRMARRAGLRPRMVHLAATAATLTDPLSHHTMSRVGAGLVGIDPSGTTALRPAMTLRAPVLQVRHVAAGARVGYGHDTRTAHATSLGLVPLGYGDGLPRLASGRAEVLHRGRRRPVVGRLSMDQLVVDLGPDGAEPGEVVTVFGPGDDGGPTAAEWAGWASTLEHEIVTGLGRRIERRVLPATRSLATAGPVRVSA